MERCKTRLSGSRWIYPVLALLAVGTSYAEPLPVKWSHPAWATPSQPFAGEVVLEGSQDAQVICHYRYTEAGEQTVSCQAVEGNGGAYRFSIPADAEAAGDELTFWLAVRGPDGQTLTSKPVTVPRSEILEIEVSGKTDQELTFPLDDWEAELLFRPCCLIISGWIEAERIPVLPVESREGLPQFLLTPFFRIDPDALVEATGGLNVVATSPGQAPEGVDPDSVKPYQWKDGKWTTVFDAVRDPKNGTIKFHFATGGLFAIGGNPSK